MCPRLGWGVPLSNVQPCVQAHRNIRAETQWLGGLKGRVLEGGEGGGWGWDPKFVYQKWPNQIFPTVNFVFPHDGHFDGGGGGGGFQGGGGTPPPAVYGHSNTSRGEGGGGPP